MLSPLLLRLPLYEPTTHLMYIIMAWLFLVLFHSLVFLTFSPVYALSLLLQLRMCACKIDSNEEQATNTTNTFKVIWQYFLLFVSFIPLARYTDFWSIGCIRMIIARPIVNDTTIFHITSFFFFICSVVFCCFSSVWLHINLKFWNTCWLCLCFVCAIFQKKNLKLFVSG